MEDRFNRKFGYPWVFLNDEPFTDEFKRRVRILTDAPLHFGLIPATHWYQPDWIDEKKATESRRRMKQKGIIYADSVSYRNMCRYNSGFFYHHELLKPYRYYWRVEPDVKFFCDLDYDPFKFMEENNKVYSFTISLLEWEATISTLWKAVTEFTTANPQYLAEDNALGFISDNGGVKYNLCHFWSNFEIADMELWRSEAYEEFFMHLESKGGFYYERWGDAPIHSIAAALFARKDQLHFFSDIGYKHEWFQHCPKGKEWERGKCSCDPEDTFDFRKNSCLKRFNALFESSP
ncbi:glycosyltransferase family 15 protein [Pterulicium gracile]|uniref:Glycosyltransferase family 15 protein n=1 Tax=Pterulicium gracile TaxID=1884261 RepID=A0A5C3R393_9AGAR|nr:glycosyltransferase family 15 protein [Pterula gracilis]